MEHYLDGLRKAGMTDEGAVERQLERIIEHLLKLEHSRNADPRRQWMIAVNGARREIARRITAAIRRALNLDLAALYEGACRDAELALIDHGEADAPCPLPARMPSMTCSARVVAG